MNLQSIMTMFSPIFDWTAPVPERHAPWKTPFQTNIHGKRCQPMRIVRIETTPHRCTISEAKRESINQQFLPEKANSKILTLTFCWACGTKIGASSCWFNISPRLPIVNVVPRFFNEAVFENMLCLFPNSSIPIKSSLETASSNISVDNRVE